ncbi:MAG: hypothetical protein ACD_16C00019G0003 [uncultured bacterium]|nr:MAG: hypothetical protein ACD_16C00019G0003 [uncultured bacterium]HBG35406.1 hypothetical protein [Holosporales bacterium]HBW24164.1 hypothetical protein [Holosporales bacterium]
MLNIIEPKDHQTYRTQIDSFLSLLNIYQNYSPSPEERQEGTFIIASDNEYGVYGGVFLLEKCIGDLERKIRQKVLTFQPDTLSVWTGQIGFYRDHEGLFSTIKILDEYLNFYQGLLKALNDFGNEKKINFLCLTLNSIEHLKLQKHGFWNYGDMVLPHESSDGLFHGILPLSGRVK